MISPRLLPLSTGCYDGTTIMAKTGHQIAQAENIDDAKDIVACVNAIAESGISPADLPKFVEALHNFHDFDSKYDRDGKYTLEIGEFWRDNIINKLRDAAACLPENRGNP